MTVMTKDLTMIDRVIKLEAIIQDLKHQLQDGPAAGLHQDDAGAQPVADAPVAGGGVCFYADKRYSVGAVLKQEGQLYMCTANGWAPSSG